MTPSHRKLLLTLDQHSALGVVALADIVGRSQVNVGKACLKLERAGYIARNGSLRYLTVQGKGALKS